MTKNDIAVELSNRTDMPKSTAIHMLAALTDILAESLAAGRNIYIRGFGTLAVKTTKERTARNIRTGVSVAVPAQRTVKFKLSKQLKTKLNS